MKQHTANIPVQADKSKATDLILFSIENSNYSDSAINSSLASTRNMIDKHKFNCETYFQKSLSVSMTCFFLKSLSR